MSDTKITVTAKTLDDVLDFLRKARTAFGNNEIDHVPSVEVIVHVSVTPSTDANGKLL